MTPERRTIEAAAAATRIERRAAADGSGEGTFLVGYAAPFDQWTTLLKTRSWVWREVIRRGAFAAAIAERQDVVSLFNHDKNFVLGRTTAGTLALRETDQGLLQETRLAGTATINDLVVVPVGRGDISGQSFAFLPRNDGSQTIVEKGDAAGTVILKRSGERITEYERDGVLYTDREVLAADLFDVSVVTRPAYGGTSVALRGGEISAEDLEREARERFEAAVRGAAPAADAAALSLRAHARLRLAEAMGR